MNYKIRSLIQKVMIDTILERFIIDVPRVKARNKWYELIFELEEEMEYEI